METVKINPGQIVGAVKPMHAVNNGPVSAAISFLRTLVFQVAAVLLLPIVRAGR